MTMRHRDRRVWVSIDWRCAYVRPSRRRKGRQHHADVRLFAFSPDVYDIVRDRFVRRLMAWPITVIWESAQQRERAMRPYTGPSSALGRVE